MIIVVTLVPLHTLQLVINNGFIVDWGRTYINSYGNWITLPISYSTNIYSVVLTHSYTGGYSSNIIFTETNKNLTRFYVSCNSDGTMSFNYITVGI